MNNFEKYTLFGKNTNKQDKLTARLRGVVQSPLAQILLFAVIMVVVGNLAIEKILPYSWASAFASTFSYAIAAVGFCLLMG